MSFIVGLFPLVGDFRFTLIDGHTTPYSDISGYYQFDQAPNNQSDMPWQMPRPYSQKRAQTDMCSIMLQTNRVGATPKVPLVTVSNATTSVALTSTYLFGAQRITGNEDTAPDGTVTPLDSFLWRFSFSMLGFTTGIHYITVRIYGDEAETEYRDYISEPIYVYDYFPNTTLIESTYYVNRKSEGVIAGGWAGLTGVTFQQRVEGFPIGYEPESVNVGYLQQDYLRLQQLAQSWRTWIYALGGISTGVPAYIHEKVSKLFEADYFQIDGKAFALNNQESGSVTRLWKTTAPNTANTRWATIPIRERYSNQWVFRTETPTPDLLILDPDSYPYALIPWVLDTGFSTVIIPAAVVDDPTAQTALVAYRNTLTTEGTFYESGGSIYFHSTVGTPSIFGAFVDLYTYFTAFYSGSATGGSNGFRYAGMSAQMVVDWNDGTNVDYYGNVPAATIVTHSFAATANPSYDVRYFHNNLIPEITWNETGGGYPVLDVFVYDHSGDMPAFMTSFVVSRCTQYGMLGSNVDFTACANWITTIQIRSCTNYTAAPWATVAMPNLDAINLGQNGFTSTSVDTFFNDFETNVWNGTLASGAIDTAQSPASPPAPPTAASLTSRNALIAESWSLSTD